MRVVVAPVRPARAGTDRSSPPSHHHPLAPEARGDRPRAQITQITSGNGVYWGFRVQMYADPSRNDPRGAGSAGSTAGSTHPKRRSYPGYGVQQRAAARALTRSFRADQRPARETAPREPQRGSRGPEARPREAHLRERRRRRWWADPGTTRRPERSRRRRPAATSEREESHGQHLSQDLGRGKERESAIPVSYESIRLGIGVRLGVQARTGSDPVAPEERVEYKAQ